MASVAVTRSSWQGTLEWREGCSGSFQQKDLWQWLERGSGPPTPRGPTEHTHLSAFSLPASHTRHGAVVAMEVSHVDVAAVHLQVPHAAPSLQGAEDREALRAGQAPRPAGAGALSGPETWQVGWGDRETARHEGKWGASALPSP